MENGHYNGCVRVIYEFPRMAALRHVHTAKSTITVQKIWSTVQRYNAARFAEVHDPINDVVSSVCQHQCITHAVMIRQVQLWKKGGNAAWN